MSQLHDWKFACKTPQGGAAGGDDVHTCVNCGMETLEPAKYPGGCEGEDAACSDCSPHPKHKGPCRFACQCRRRSKEDRYRGGTPAPSWG